jgi:hypothetical protein
MEDSIKETENLDGKIKNEVKHFYNKLIKITKYAISIEENIRNKSISSILQLFTKDEAEKFTNLLYRAYNGELDPIEVDPYFKDSSKELLDSGKIHKSIAFSKKSESSRPENVDPIPGQGPLIKLVADR